MNLSKMHLELGPLHLLRCQYCFLADFDRAGRHGRENMSAAWFTSSDINEPFTICGNIGKGHSDTDIIFAENQFYLATQMDTDYISSCPCVETVKARVGVDTKNDGSINKWGAWEEVAEHYYPIQGFAKQNGKTPAQLDFGDLPEGFGFQFEIEIINSNDSPAKPIIDKVTLSFKE